MDKIAGVIAQELGVKEFQVQNTIKLIDDGNTIPESKTQLANSGMKLRVMVTTAITSAATVKLVGKDKTTDSSYKDVAVYTIPVSEAGKIYDFVLPEDSPCVLNVKVTGGSAAGKLFVRFEPMSRGY